MSQQKPLLIRSLLSEFVVIMAGVLAALAVDQWKDALDARRLEAHEQHVRFLGSFFDSGPSELDTMPEDSLASALSRAFTQVMTLDPASSTLDALLNSGRMRLLRDSELRAALLNWSTYLDDSREEAAKLLNTLDRSLTLPHAAAALKEVPGVPMGRFDSGRVADVRAIQHLGELERLRDVTAEILERLDGDE